MKTFVDVIASDGLENELLLMADGRASVQEALNWLRSQKNCNEPHVCSKKIAVFILLINERYITIEGLKLQLMPAGEALVCHLQRNDD